MSLSLIFRKRRKQTHVPTESKDDKYWARRMKNNEAAKRSRDMRIKREKVVFEENSRLESDNREMRSELVSFCRFFLLADFECAVFNLQ